MAGFDTYKDAFPHTKLTRSQEGVLEVVLHTNGGTLIFNGYAHEEFVELFHQIGQDAGNRVIILTGAGEAFIDRIESWTPPNPMTEAGADEKTLYAVLHALQYIGEAVSRLPVKITNLAPQGPWQKIKAMRNLIAHDYAGIESGGSVANCGAPVARVAHRR